MFCRCLLEETRQLKRRQEVEFRLSVSTTKKETKIHKSNIYTQTKQQTKFYYIDLGQPKSAGPGPGF